MKDYIIKAVDETLSARFFIARTTNMVQEIKNIHDSSATGSAAMGRLATMASIMGLGLKSEGDTVTLRMDGGGIGGKLIAVSDSKGNVRVSASNPRADVGPNEKGKLDVGTFVGRDGFISIVRDFGLKNPYTGVSKIVTGEVAEDFANYFFNSEQTPTVVSLGVLVDTDLSIKSAGGIFIQLMPDPDTDFVDKLEKIIENLPPISRMIDQGLSPEDILEKYFGQLKPEVVGKDEVEYKCNCSKERIEQALASIGRNDLEEMKVEDKGAQVVCDFCKSEYNFNEQDLEEIIKNAQA